MTNYELPDPKDEKQWAKCLALSFKTLKGVEFDDRGWDKVHFGRTVKATKTLLEICGSFRSADACMVEVAEWLEGMGVSWGIETIVRHAHDWVQRKQGGRNASASRKRLFDAIAKSKTEGIVEPLRKVSDAGEILDAVGSGNQDENKRKENGTRP